MVTIRIDENGDYELNGNNITVFMGKYAGIYASQDDMHVEHIIAQSKDLDEVLSSTIRYIEGGKQ